MALAFVLLCLSISTLTEGRGFRQRSAAEVRMDMHKVQQELQEALRGALGHGHGVEHDQIAVANATLHTMFLSLPKNQHGRVGAAAMRYAVQRYFSKSHGWIIKGFESHHNEHYSQNNSILGSKIPGYVEATLEEMLAKGGFALPDILTVVVVIERLVFDEVARSIEAAYHLNHLVTENTLKHLVTENELTSVLESHLITEMLERHDFSEELHAEDREYIHELYPNWESVQMFVQDIIAGETSSLSHSAVRNPFTGMRVQGFSFDDAVRIAQRISNEYGRWGNQECMELRSHLAEMDRRADGRLPLPEFYQLADDKWGFQEAPQYLRELGALDESSTLKGPRIIISNYAYGMSNCLSSTPYYSVCCLNECESLLQQIETRVANPSASPAEILAALNGVKMTSYTIEVTDISSKLLKTLDEIAEKGHGKVPLHGRLFAQWLHYAFPHECPFPYRAGALKPKTQGERLAQGEAIFVEEAERDAIIYFEAHNSTAAEEEEAELWSWDEEVMQSQWHQIPDLMESRKASGFMPWAAIIALSLVFVISRLNSIMAAVVRKRTLLPTAMKSHDL